MRLEELQSFIQGLWGEPGVRSLEQGALLSTRESVESALRVPSHFLLKADVIPRSLSMSPGVAGACTHSA